MNYWSRNTVAGLGCSLLTLVLCSAPNRDAPSIDVVKGNVVIINKKGARTLALDQKISIGDTINVEDGQSQLVMRFTNGSKLHCNVGTRIVIESVKSHSRKIVLLHGDCYSSCTDGIAGSDTITVRTMHTELTAVNAHFSLYYNNAVKEFITTVLTGSVESNRNGLKQQIPPCTRYSQVDRESGQLQPPSVRELELLKLWVNSLQLEELLVKNDCTLQALASENLPPQWLKFPTEGGLAGEQYIDTIQASDPEGNTLKYRLVKGPSGLHIEDTTGKITFLPQSAGSYDVGIEAIDSGEKSITYEFVIVVSEKSSLRLNVPGVIPINAPITISAQIRSGKTTVKKVLYRFDLDGNGVFDLPVSRNFGVQSIYKNQKFKKEGTFKVIAEAKLADGTVVKATRKVIVNASPEAFLTANPVIGPSGSVVTFDASGSKDSRDPPEQLRMRFDVNGDGIWDIPADAKFTKERIFRHTYNQNGMFRAIVQVYDSQGLWDTASVNVHIFRHLAMKSINGPDSANVGDSLTYIAIADNPEFPVVSYVWTLSGPEGQTISEDKKQVRLSMSKEGKYTLSCKITDEKGQSAQVSRSIHIANSRTIIDAGGPYAVNVNSSLTVHGKASDQDSKIIEYLWDFDGDGSADAQSTDNSLAEWTFKKSGTKTISFTVKTDDGKSAVSKARVEVKNTAPVVEAGPDILAKSGRKVSLNGVAVDLEKNICEYAWDFDNDGSFDWTSKDTGAVEHVFKEYSIALFRVTDCDGAFSDDSLKVVVCPENMETVENGKYCIDTYEFPNKKNEIPKLDVSYEEALQLCKDQGKRLCTVEEWERACRNDQTKLMYPYGKNYQVDKCNNLGNMLSKNKVAPSGFFQECTGSTGAHDMSGNAAEWVEAKGGNPYVYGGSWQNGGDGSKCHSMVQLERGKKYFYVGFRCCK